MRLVSASVSNFGSYDSLEFSYENQGVTLITGATGSGKSTLLDIAPWILFGRTSKNGSVEEIIRWGSALPAKGTLTSEVNGARVKVTRSRGLKGKDNDLYFTVDGGDEIRGKDLADTQKLLNGILGMDAEAYLLGSYYHEFSQAGAFFTTTPKIRRAICDQLVDMSLSKKLTVLLSDKKKVLTKELDNAQGQISKYEAEATFAEGEADRAQKLERSFDSERNQRRAQLDRAILDFTKKQQERISRLVVPNPDAARYGTIVSAVQELGALIASITDVCSSCGGPSDPQRKNALEAELRALEEQGREYARQVKRKAEIEAQIKDIESQENPYPAQLADLERAENPYQAIYATNVARAESARAKVAECSGQVKSLGLRLLDLETLGHLVQVFRGEQLQDAVTLLEDTANGYMEEYFDGEFRIELKIDEEGDQVDIEIMKDGNLCSYTQLSKGQRGMNKLCFAVAVMKCISEKRGLKFSALFLDEALDGLDGELKTKALSLLNKLGTEHESVFVIDHASEVKALVDNQKQVRLEGGVSRVYEG